MGKVGGISARAGKVRFNTPHVEKQPKEKKKTGRAKKKELYNTREEDHFVTIKQNSIIGK
jgi:small subunit ribosomal protein S30e